MVIRTASIKDPLPAQGGLRILVTRKWPRGLPRESIDLWVKELGGTAELMRDYKKKKISASSFHARYLAEASDPGRHAAIQDLQRRAMNGKDLILLCDGEDEAESVRGVLKEILETH
ncbi:MAG: DUF488 family protein [Planctomycetes bacterium]|nr:DUF488 family protein [Planctomycetota bacterium]